MDDNDMCGEEPSSSSTSHLLGGKKRRAIRHTEQHIDREREVGFPGKNVPRLNGQAHITGDAVNKDNAHPERRIEPKSTTSWIRET